MRLWPLDTISAMSVLLLLVGLAGLIGGGEVLIRGAVGMARRLGVPELLVGLTVVAFGTSTPELVVNLVAAGRGNAEVGFGNVIGSNTANIGLLLGITAMVRPLSVHLGVVTREIPMMLLASFAALVLAEDRLLTGRAGDVFDRDDGIMLLLLFGVFLYYLLVDALHQRRVEAQLRPDEAEPMGWGRIGLLTVVGLILLVVGGELTVRGATGIARALGLSDVIIALTLVAVGTSLPELATSLAAARRGNTDVAIGNIVGSNIYNLLFIFGLTSTISPIRLPVGGTIDLLVMIGFSVLLLPMAITDRRRLTRAEAGVLLLLYGGYITWLAVR